MRGIDRWGNVVEVEVFHYKNAEDEGREPEQSDQGANRTATAAGRQRLEQIRRLDSRDGAGLDIGEELLKGDQIGGSGRGRRSARCGPLSP